MIINVDKTGRKKEKLQEKMESELDLTIAMGEKGIGPVIYDALFHEIDSDKIYKYKNLDNMLQMIRKGYKEKNNKTYPQFQKMEENINTCESSSSVTCHIVNIQIISMEGFEMDGNDALFKKKISNHIRCKIIEDFIKLIHRQIYEMKVYCYDIKPSNFVLNNKGLKYPLVKMIDFGIDFCTYKRIYTKYENSEVILEGMYPADMLFFSNVIQILLILNYQEFFNKMNNNNIRLYALCFFKNQYMKQIMNKDWKSIVKLFVNLAYQNNNSKKFDPSSMLMHYSGIDYKKSEDESFKFITDSIEKIYLLI